MLQSRKAMDFYSILHIWVFCKTNPWLFIAINIYYGNYGIIKSDLLRYLTEPVDSKNDVKENCGASKLVKKKNRLDK